MTNAEFDADQLRRLERAIDGLQDRVCIIDTGRPGRIDAPRYRLIANTIGAVAAAGDSSR